MSAHYYTNEIIVDEFILKCKRHQSFKLLLALHALVNSLFKWFLLLQYKVTAFNLMDFHLKVVACFKRRAYFETWSVIAIPLFFHAVMLDFAMEFETA